MLPNIITTARKSLKQYYFMRSGIVFFLLVVANHSLCAAGFQLREQSALGQGSSFSGIAAGAEDVSSLFFNGASMALINGSAISASLSHIRLSGGFKNGMASSSNGKSISGVGGYKNLESFIPSFSAMYSLAKELKLGISVNSPWGLETKYDAMWIGRYHGVQSKLESININPIVALRMTEMVSLSIGFQAQYMDARMSNAIDFGTIGMLNSIPGSNPGMLSQDGLIKISGDDWGYGWTAGILLELSDNTRLGLGFRSKISHDLQGDAEFRLDHQGIGRLVQAASGTFTDTNASVRITTPEFYSLGILHDFDSKWSFMGELDLTRWSRLDKFEINFSNKQQDNAITTLKWSDTWFGSLGVEFRPSVRWQFRGGLAYEEGATSTRFRTVGIPDNERIWLSVGATYSPNKTIKIHTAYTHIRMKNTELDLQAFSAKNTVSENVFRGNLSGELDNSVNILTVGVTLGF